MLKSVSICVVLCAASPALAQDGFGFSGDDFAYDSPGDALQLRGSLGVIGIEAREHVFTGDNNLSLLIWQSVAPMVSTDVKLNMDDNWTLKASFRAALGGDSYMEDYDWIVPPGPSYNFDDWSHRSQSPNTNLEWYYDAAIELGKDIPANESLSINLNGGFKYTDVQWTAIGGSYIYSSDPGYRDDIGVFPDTPGITYRQQLPTLYAGLDADAHADGWTVGLSGRGGFTFMGTGTDHHWMRTPPLLFIDHMSMAPMAAVSGSAGYAFSDHLSAYVEGSIEKVFLGRADTDVYNDSTGAFIQHEPGAGGNELGTATFSAGLKGSF